MLVAVQVMSGLSLSRKSAVAEASHVPVALGRARHQ